MFVDRYTTDERGIRFISRTAVDLPIETVEMTVIKNRMILLCKEICLVYKFDGGSQLELVSRISDKLVSLNDHPAGILGIDIAS